MINKLQKINRSMPVTWYSGVAECGGKYIALCNKWMEYECNINFHLDMECLTKYDNSINLEEIYMDDEYFQMLDKQQMEILKEAGVLLIIATKKYQIK